MDSPAPSFLHRVPLFAGLAPGALAEIEQRMRRREFLPQSLIVREGSAGDSAFFILSGRAAVRRKDPESGIDFLLAELGEGEMFGEMALLTRKPRTASVTALETTACAVLEQADFERLLREHPPLALSIMAVLAVRLEDADRHVGIDYVNLARVKVDPRVLALLPLPIMNEHHVVPIAFCNNRLTLAMTNPNNIVAFDDVRRMIKGVLIEPAIVTEEDFRRFMTTVYPTLVEWATVTTDTSCGAVNSMHDSFTPLGGLVPLANIMLSETIFGGVGSGMYGILIYVVLSVFIAGLMVGRTPEYLGKKIESYDVKMAMLVTLVFPLVILVFTAISVVSPGFGTSQIANQATRLVGDSLCFHRRRRQQRIGFRRHFGEHALVQHDYRHHDAGRALLHDHSHAGNCR